MYITDVQGGRGPAVGPLLPAGEEGLPTCEMGRGAGGGGQRGREGGERQTALARIVEAPEQARCIAGAVKACVCALVCARPCVCVRARACVRACVCERVYSGDSEQLQGCVLIRSGPSETGARFMKQPQVYQSNSIALINERCGQAAAGAAGAGVGAHGGRREGSEREERG